MANALLLFGIGLAGPSSTAAWTPADLGASLALWLDADDASTITLNGTTVSQWSDKSGNGRNATQATASLQPTYTASGIGGKPSVTFAPEGGTAQDRLNVTFTLTENNITAFALAKKPSSSGSLKHRYGRVLSFRNTSGNDYSNTNGWIPAFMAQSDAFGGVNPPNIVSYRNNATITAQSMVYNTPYIIGSTLSGSTGTMRVNGNQTSGTTSATAVNINQMLIGASPQGIDSEMYGDIAEVIVTSALSLADQQRIEGYIAWKWGGI
jgi:hypothetical protein